MRAARINDQKEPPTESADRQRLSQTAGCRTAKSHLHLDPHRRVVAGLFPAPRLAVDACGLEPLRQRRAEQGVVDADAGVALERVPPIRPESVDPLVWTEMPDRVG